MYFKIGDREVLYSNASLVTGSILCENVSLVTDIKLYDNVS